MSRECLITSSCGDEPLLVLLPDHLPVLFFATDFLPAHFDEDLRLGVQAQPVPSTSLV